MSERVSSLKPRLTPEFLATLLEAARIYGWGGDYYEITCFVRECYYIAETAPPGDEEMEPYEEVGD